jgi:hypothetical protein
MRTTAMTEAQEQALGLFADAILKLALHLQQEAMAADDLDQKVRLAGAVHQLGRGLRQTVALPPSRHRRNPSPTNGRRRTSPSIPNPSPCAVDAIG